MMEKLDYSQKPGFPAIRTKPVDSGLFGAAGWDAADFYSVASCYGTLQDDIELCDTGNIMVNGDHDIPRLAYHRTPESWKAAWDFSLSLRAFGFVLWWRR